MPSGNFEISRRQVLAGAAVTTALASASTAASASAGPSGKVRPAKPVPTIRIAMTVNGEERQAEVDTRTTLLDLLRDHLRLTGTKKGCDHGHCGACTVFADGIRINSCLSLAAMHDGREITTIEGLGKPERLHPVQAAFVKHDGYQCGYCTPGQICSVVGTLDEIRQGVPSHVTADLEAPMLPTPLEIRERMSGNICRCGAYAHIHAAIAELVGEAS